jgi:two-component system, OmpR family, sensor histidine kinase VicK
MEEKKENEKIRGAEEKKMFRIIEEVAKLAAGDFAVNLQISDKMDEYDALSAGINILAEEMREKTYKLESTINEIKKSRAILYSLAEDIQGEKEKIEVKVKERTREISENLGRMESLVESVKLGIIMVDLSLNIILTNSTAKAIFGKFPGESLDFQELEKNLKDVNLSQALSTYVQAGKPTNIKEAVLRGRYFRIYLSPVRDINEKYFIGAVMIIEDITDSKMLDQMRSEIISTTSHQLRTPLSVVKGNLEMILGGDFGELKKEQREILEEAAGGNDRMIKLVNDLMDVSKITDNKLELKMVPVQLETLASESVKELMPFAAKNKVSLVYNPPKNPLREVKVDLMRTKQVLQNMIDNAIKYSRAVKDGAVKVAVMEIKEKNMVQVVVKDNGVGIPKEEQGKIFERFFRASNAVMQDPGGGTGLGLYIAKAVVEQLGGKFWFESEGIGKGTSFYCALPIEMKEKTEN